MRLTAKELREWDDDMLIPLLVVARRSRPDEAKRIEAELEQRREAAAQAEAEDGDWRKADEDTRNATAEDGDFS
jgi:hypothetical protein